MDSEKPVLVYATFPDQAAADSLGAALVERRLAACINIIPGMVSVYRWEGRTERAEEVVMIAKTRASLAEPVIEAIRAGHPYALPAIVVLPLSGGSHDYCRWIIDETS